MKVEPVCEVRDSLCLVSEVEGIGISQVVLESTPTSCCRAKSNSGRSNFESSKLSETDVEVNAFTRKLAWSAPGGVRTTGEYARYRVQSNSVKGRDYLVDVECMQCECESATVGKMAQARAAKGYVTFEELCPHIARALVYHAFVEIGAHGPTMRMEGA